MTPERWQTVKKNLTEALERPADQRRSFIEKVCGSDADLRDDLLRLIEADAAPDVIPPPTAGSDHQAGERAVGGVAPELSGVRPKNIGDTSTTMVGRRVGGFTITRLIGVGGMGAVYEAKQDYPSRVVALKLLRWGLASTTALKRFKFEAEVLARLQHPGIAQLFEAGVQSIDGPGLPYFAMELVPDARAIGDYAAACNLGIRERIGLFIKVCEAVQHGHVRGVVHRDLKPSNILVTQNERDASSESAAQPTWIPQPKIIDFGVAGATDSDIALTPLATDAKQLIGTIQYMSPEQCTGRADDIDVRSDVYSLGVVLFELLTGRHPYDLSGSHTLEAPSIIRDRAPDRPSAIVPSVRGDLEIIILKALEKERERRYQSAQQFADDLARYLAGEAVLARPASAAYQVLVFARRNRSLVASVLAIIFVLIAGIGVSLAMYREAVIARDAARASESRAEQQSEVAKIEAKRAKRVADFLADSFTSIDSSAARNSPDAPGWDARFYPFTAAIHRKHRTAAKLGAEATVLDVLTSAAAELDTAFADEPLVQADLAVALAKGIAAAGGTTEAYRALYEKAIKARRNVLGSAHRDTIFALNELGINYAGFNYWQGAEPLFQEAIDACPAVYGPLSAQELEIRRSRVGVLLIDESQYRRAAAIQRETFDRCVRELGPDNPATLLEESWLGWILGGNGDVDEGIVLGRHAYNGLAAALGPDHHVAGEAAWRLSDTLWDESSRANRLEAVLLNQRGVAAFEEQFGADSDHTHWLRKGVQDVLIRAGDYASSEALCRKMVESLRRTHSDTDGERLNVMCRLSRAIVWNHGDLSEAESLARGAIDRVNDPRGEQAVFFNATLADVLRASGRIEEATQRCTDALGHMRQSVAEHGGNEGGFQARAWEYVYCTLAQCLADQERTDEAAAAFENAWNHRNSNPKIQFTIDIMLLRHGAAFFDRVGDKPRSLQWHQALQVIALDPIEHQPTARD